MNNKFSKSWINMRIYYDDLARSDALVKFLKRSNKADSYHLIDMCCGSGSFLIWTLKNELIFKECTLVDNDLDLLKSVKSNLRKNLKGKYSFKANTNNSDLEIFRGSEVRSTVRIKKGDCDEYKIGKNQSYIISYSAAIDLMSKSSINNSLSKLGDGNVLFYSLCFDGQVKWNPSHPYDKYILSMFNRHQRSNKGFGAALGYESIEFLTKKAAKLGYRVAIKDSPWAIENKSERDMAFLKRYILDIKKSLYHLDQVDMDILKKWYLDKMNSLTNKKVRVHVGHKDILIHR